MEFNQNKINNFSSLVKFCNGIFFFWSLSGGEGGDKTRKKPTHILDISFNPFMQMTIPLKEVIEKYWLLTYLIFLIFILGSF